MRSIRYIEKFIRHYLKVFEDLQAYNCFDEIEQAEIRGQRLAFKLVLEVIKKVKD